MNPGNFVDGKGGDEAEKLDLRATHKIHGSKPTKSQHANQSQKTFGAIFGGDFRIRTKNNKIKLEKQRGGSEIVKTWLLIPR